MGLYPSTLFHFTAKERFYSILEGNFRVSYARERLGTETSNVSIAVPMVSFCDLRLSELKAVESYGEYGIGLKKEWAIRKGLNPVWYVNRSSSVIQSLTDCIRYVNRLKAENSDPVIAKKHRKALMDMMDTCRFIKSYKGVLERRDQPPKENYVFANEREWRYVPAHTEELKAYVSAEAIDTEEKKRELNAKVSHCRLDFEPDDISYLVVPSDDDVIELFNYLLKVKKKYNAEAVARLTSRMLTADQINNDV